MTQRTQEERIHKDTPPRLRQDLDKKQRGGIPEERALEYCELRRVAKGEEGDGCGVEQEVSFLYRHDGAMAEQQREVRTRRNRGQEVNR